MAPTIEVKDEVKGEHVRFLLRPHRRAGPGQAHRRRRWRSRALRPWLPPVPAARRLRAVPARLRGPLLRILRREDRGCGGGREGDEGEGEPIFLAGTQRLGRTSGAVDLLWLSPDSSTLAASIGGTVNFFSVDSLLNKWILSGGSVTIASF